jgi:hypothetical protein
MKLWAATSGDYDDYRIAAIFDCADKAEAYRNYHNCCRVEEIGTLNPSVPVASDFMWSGHVNLTDDSKEIRIYRESNERSTKNWFYSGYGSRNASLECVVPAFDKESAEVIMQSALTLFLEGGFSITVSETENVGNIRKDGTPSLHATHQLRHAIKKIWKDDELVEVDRDTQSVKLFYGSHQAEVWK